ncbi:hypothetical protein PTKIN_Ptkin09bG0177600 [Pterospermum kingtungense]
MNYDKVKEKTSLHDASSSNMWEVEDAIFTEVVGKERNGLVRGFGMRPTPTNYYGASSSQNQSEKEVRNLREGLRSMQQCLQQTE